MLNDATVSNGDIATLLGGLFAGAMVLILAIIVIGFVLFVVDLIATAKIFQKAGRNPILTLVPFYRTYVMFDISTGKPLLFLPGLIQFLTMFLIRPVYGNENLNVLSVIIASILGLLNITVFILNIYLAVMLSKSFGHGIGFAIGLIILGPIFKGILGFSSCEYEGVGGNGADTSYSASAPAPQPAYNDPYDYDDEDEDDDDEDETPAAPQPSIKTAPKPAIKKPTAKIPKCPSCGGALEVSEDGTKFKCTACGKQFKRK